jgi:beta-glucanase (GH16 family)
MSRVAVVASSIAVAAVASVLGLIGLSGAAGATKTVTGHACTIVGTSKPEVIKGTSRADVICSLAGNDVIYGLGGDDILDGGPGNDKIFGGSGNDQIFGGSGSDAVDGGTGANKCVKDAKESSTRTCTYLAALPKLATPKPSSTPADAPSQTPSSSPTQTPSSSPSSSPSAPTNAPPTTPTTNSTALTLDFEAASTSSLLGFSGDAATIDAHPSAGASASTKAVKVVRGDQTTSGTIFYVAPSGINLVSNSVKSVSALIYSPQAGKPILLKLEDASDATKSIETFATASTIGWQTLTFNFANTRPGTPSFDSSVRYRKAVIFFDFGATTSGSTYYLDQVLFEGASSASDSAPANPPQSGFTVGALLWSDEFAGSGSLDVNKWTARSCGHSSANGGGTCHNNEQQIYTPSAISLDGVGSAVVTTERLPSPQTGGCLAWSTQCSFTSGRFDTQGKVSFQYGVLEARIQNPLGGANWPAFWLLGTNITTPGVGWPASGEIDVMEGKSRTQTSGAIHWSNGGNDAFDYADFSGTDFTSGYHVYKLYWLENYVALYVDGNKILEETPQSLSTSGAWAFNHPFFLLLNNAVSANGGFAGTYDGWTRSQMKIDYVRHYQLNGVGQVFNQ